MTVVTNVTPGTFSGEMTVPHGHVIPPNRKPPPWRRRACRSSSAFWDAAVQAKQLGLLQ